MSGIWSLGFRVSDVFLGFRVLRFFCSETSVLRMSKAIGGELSSFMLMVLLRPSFKVMQRGCGFRV